MTQFYPPASPTNWTPDSKFMLQLYTGCGQYSLNHSERWWGKGWAHIDLLPSRSIMIKRLEHFISTINDIQLFGYVLGYLCLKHSTTQTKHNDGLLALTFCVFQERFTMLDRNKDGTLSRVDLKKTYRMMPLESCATLFFQSVPPPPLPQ